MIESLTFFLTTYGVKSIIVAKIIELIGTVLPPPFKRLFLWFLKYEVIWFGKVAILGFPVVITGEMVLGFIIGKSLLGF